MALKLTKEMEAEARAMYEKLASAPNRTPKNKAPPSGYVWVRTIPGGAAHLEKESDVLERRKEQEADLRRIKRAGGKVRIIL